MTKLALIAGRVIDPANRIDEITNLYIAQGKIIARAVQPPDGFVADQTLQCSEHIVCPGLVDIHANLIAAGRSDLETLTQQLRYAAMAGITSVATYAFNDNYCLEPGEIKYLAQHSGRQQASAQVYFIGALTQALQGNRLNELMLLKAAGCIGFSNGNRIISNTLVKRRCYDYAAMLGIKVFIIALDPFLANGGFMHEGDMSVRFGVPAVPALAETIALTQELMLVEESGVQAHFGRLSAAKSVAILAKAKEAYLPISADCTIMQLFLSDQQVCLENGFYLVQPPLRAPFDREQLRQGIKGGIIDAICSDHIKLSRQTKEVPFQDAEPGIASWPTLLPLALQLSKEMQLPLIDLIARLTYLPAKALGIEADQLDIGANANLVIIDPNENWVLNSDLLKKFGVNTPWANQSLKGRVKYTLLAGDIIYQS